MSSLFVCLFHTRYNSQKSEGFLYPVHNQLQIHGNSLSTQNNHGSFFCKFLASWDSWLRFSNVCLICFKILVTLCGGRQLDSFFNFLFRSVFSAYVYIYLSKSFSFGWRFQFYVYNTNYLQISCLTRRKYLNKKFNKTL